MESPLLGKWTTLAVGYGLVVSTLYLHAFWGTFEVNFLEYASIPDVLTASLHPLLSLILGIAILNAIAHLLLRPYTRPRSNTDSILTDPSSRRPRVIVWIWLASIASIIIFAQTPIKWGIVAAMTGILIGLSPHPTWLRQLIPSRATRGIVVLTVIYTLGTSYWRGQIDAINASEGRGKLTVDVQRSGLNLRVAPNRPATHLGTLGDYTFLLESATGHVVMLKLEEGASLVMRPNPRRPDWREFSWR